MSGSGFQQAFELARDAQAAGLVVTCMAPLRCGHGGDAEVEFLVGLYQPDGTLWAEGSHESAEQIREQHIEGWRRQQSLDQGIGDLAAEHGASTS